MRTVSGTVRRARGLRREMSLPEVVLWKDLRRGAMENVRFRRQHPIGPYVLDFYCTAAQLAVEIDGAHHQEAIQIQHDARRDGWLNSQGVTVLRFIASDVLNDDAREGVLARIREALLDPPP